MKGVFKMAAKQTTWWDKNGKVNTGYIIDGKTYTDEAGTARVPVGATVKTNGGTFKMTENGGVPTMATARNQYQQQSNAAIDAYNAANEAQRRRVQSATDAAIAEINRQKQVAEQNRRDADIAARDAYRAAANPFGALEEQRVRLGLDNSGYAESSKLKLASDYAAQQTANLRSLNEQLAALEVQIAEARANGEMELANILESRAQNVMNQRTALAGNLFNADMSSISQAAQERQFREQMAFNQAQADEQRKQYIAGLYLEAGISSPELASALGMKQENADALVAAYNAQRMASQRSSGGGGTPKNEKPIDTAYISNLLNAIKASGLTVEEYLKSYGNALDLNANEIAALYQEFYAGKNPSGGEESSAYKKAIDVIGGMKRRGKGSSEAITAYINSLPKGALTTSELDALIDTYVLQEA